jgi:hypothetical protein
MEAREGDGRITLRWILGRSCEDERLLELAQDHAQPPGFGISAMLNLRVLIT